MTAGERLKQLAGVSGTAAALLLVIGAGATTGGTLVNYSGLLTGTAAEHLLTDVAQPPSVITQPSTGGGGLTSFSRKKYNRKSDETTLFLTGLL